MKMLIILFPPSIKRIKNIFRKIIKNMEIDHIALPCLRAAFYPEMAVCPILLTDHPLHPPEVQNLVEYFERILENDERKVIPAKRTRQMKQQQFHAQSETHRKYKKYSFQFKRKIVMEVQGILPIYEGKINECIREKAKQHKIHPKNVFRWVHSGKLVRREGGRQAKYPVLEKKLIQFIEITPQAKRRDILAKAHKLKNQLNLKGDFCFSKGWYERFRVRISRRKKMKQIDSESEWSFSLNNKNLSTLEQQKVESLVEQI